MTSLPQQLYYISQGESLKDHLNGIEKVCSAGCKLVQLRLKGFSINQVAATAKKAQLICKNYGAQLIINDYIDVVRNLDGVGLHLGKNDYSLKTAKLKLPNLIIGGTANTLEDCVRLSKEGAAYIGLGPLRFTKTKSNLDPILGLEGYKEILTKLKSLKINIPVYAIGGIESTDIPILIEIGLSGIAVSSLFANETENEIKKIIELYE